MILSGKRKRGCGVTTGVISFPFSNGKLRAFSRKGIKWIIHELPIL
jgi:hypothetical protein